MLILSAFSKQAYYSALPQKGMAVRGKPRLPWLLLLVAVTAVLPSSAVYSDNDYRAIIRNAIKQYPKLAEFPKTSDHPKGKQFAMMIAIPPQDYITGNTNIQLNPPPTWQKGNHYPVEPSVIGNYLVARPDTRSEALQRGGVRQHAEIKLLNQLNELLTKFEQKYGRPPARVLLYTWFTPCPDCTNFILQTVNSYQRLHLAVLYSVNREMPSIGMTYKSNEENRQKLRNAGIPVFDVNLPSIGSQGGGENGEGQGGGRNGGGSSFGGGGDVGQLQRYHSSFMNTLPVKYNPFFNPLQNQMRQNLGRYDSTRQFTTYNGNQNLNGKGYGQVQPYQSLFMNNLSVRYNPSLNLPQNQMRQNLGRYGSTRQFTMYNGRNRLTPPPPNTNTWFKNTQSILKRFKVPRGR